MAGSRRQSPFPFYEQSLGPTILPAKRAIYAPASYSEDLSAEYTHTPTPSSITDHLPYDRRLTPSHTWHTPEYEYSSDASPMISSPYLSHSPIVPQQGSYPGVVAVSPHPIPHPALVDHRVVEPAMPVRAQIPLSRSPPRLVKNRRSVPYIETQVSPHPGLVPGARRIVPSSSHPHPGLVRVVVPRATQGCYSEPGYAPEEPIRSHMLQPGPRAKARMGVALKRGVGKSDSSGGIGRTMFENRKNSIGARHNGGVKKIALTDLTTAKNARHLYTVVKHDIDQSNTYHAVFTCYHLSHECDAVVRVSYEDRGHKKTLYYLSHRAVLQELFPVPRSGWLAVRCARLAALQMKNLLTIAYGRNADWHDGHLVPLFALFCTLSVRLEFVNALRMRIVEVGARGDHVALFMRQARETGMQELQNMFSQTLEWTEQLDEGSADARLTGSASLPEEEKGPGSMCAECCQWRPKMFYSKVQWNRRIRDVRRCKECCERKKAWEANSRS